MGRICGVAENWSNAFRTCPLHLPPAPASAPTSVPLPEVFYGARTINSRHDVAYGLQHL